MSHTSQIKAELARVPLSKGPLRAAELATILRFSGGLHLISGRIAIEIELEDNQLSRRISRAILELYGIQSDVSAVSATSKKVSGYQIRVLKDGELLARQTGLIDNRGRPVRGLPASLVSSNLDEGRAIWRGAFLATGYLTDPNKIVSLEINAPSNEAAMALVGVARRLEVSAKAREVRGYFKVLIREGEAIERLLREIGANESLLAWNEARSKREIRGSTNRLANFDDANLRRSALAAVAAGARVQRALEILSNDVPAHLKYAGELRLNHRDASLDELGRLAVPPMTKDAIAGRIRRLLAMADKQASELGIPNTEEALEDLSELAAEE